MEKAPAWTWDDVSRASCDQAKGMALLIQDLNVLQQVVEWDLRATVRKAAARRLLQLEKQLKS